MLYDNLELHNVAELVEVPGRPGLLLQRVPEKVRQQLRPATQAVYRQAAGCEIRCVSGGGTVKLTLMSYSGPVQAYSYAGDFPVGTHTIGEEPTTVELTLPEPGFLAMDALDRNELTFASSVWRLLFPKGEIHILAIEGESIRPPRADEVPSRRYLAYGTSITQGIAATHPALTYVKQVGWRLRADVINLGASGTAFCEPALADYLAARDDWDFASMCLSVNMLNQGVSAGEFEARATYLVDSVARGHAGKPLVCIGLFPSFHDVGLRWPGKDSVSTADEYRAVLQGIVQRLGLPHVQYVDGRELLTSMNGLIHDLLHPNDYGMMEIGEKLAAILRQKL
ncbi:SGNH/GDSL hydrolase family protein [Paenibacillus cremeus]|uniref:SGNH hydrolase-type esterase domain-containing protein n=1 Tax=Paenibacillus cremeus TaxID=2163881 RepID=A0A559KAP0_9BACL|nr:SGNH/GDSL hydrolase family protein [Paenibacillus cremeus]TVY09197.1 hypothetical protein FPZ49_14750 [Paenibacillus cremeus]